MRVKIHTTYTVNIMTISPLHISSGRGDLFSNQDFVLGQNKAAIIDLDRLYNDMTDAELAAASADIKLSQLLRGRQAGKYIAYLADLPAGGASPDRVREQIKDAFLKPYIPGSEIKGALRTAIAWSQYQAPLDLGGVSEQPYKREGKKADDHIEASIFDYDLHNTQKDLMRGLRVTDSYTAVGQSRLQALPVRVFSIKGQAGSHALQPKPGNAIWVEAIPPKASFQGTLTLDEYALSEHPERPDVVLHRKRHLLDDIASICKKFSEELIRKEKDFYSQYGNRAMSGFYRQLQDMHSKLKADEFFLWLGWGTGWRAKTVGTRLRPEDIEKVYNTYGDKQLGRWESPLFPAVFPKSRRLVAVGQEQIPIGWTKVQLKPISGGQTD